MALVVVVGVSMNVYFALVFTVLWNESRAKSYEARAKSDEAAVKLTTEYLRTIEVLRVGVRDEDDLALNVTEKVFGEEQEVR